MKLRRQISKKKKKKKKKKITYLPTLFFSDLVSGNTAIFFLGLMEHLLSIS